MGLDGFSMGNLGLNADMTSAQMAAQSEQLALKESEIKIKDVTEMAEDTEVKRKEEDSDGQNFFDDGFGKKKNKQDTNENKDENDEELLKRSFENKNPRDFALRINYTTELIELYNSKDEEIIETIQAKDLIDVVSKLDNASGVLVNRKI